VKIQIQLTEEHLDNGYPTSPCYCPIANAICAALNLQNPEAYIASEFDDSPVDPHDWVHREPCLDTPVRVGYNACYINQQQIDLPPSITELIDSFDCFGSAWRVSGGEIKPTSFELDIPDELAKELNL
jgi:hypothetical protein